MASPNTLPSTTHPSFPARFLFDDTAEAAPSPSPLHRGPSLPPNYTDPPPHSLEKPPAYDLPPPPTYTPLDPSPPAYILRPPYILAGSPSDTALVPRYHFDLVRSRAGAEHALRVRRLGARESKQVEAWLREERGRRRSAACGTHGGGALDEDDEDGGARGLFAMGNAARTGSVASSSATTTTTSSLLARVRTSSTSVTAASTSGSSSTGSVEDPRCRGCGSSGPAPQPFRLPDHLAYDAAETMYTIARVYTYSRAPRGTARSCPLEIRGQRTHTVSGILELSKDATGASNLLRRWRFDRVTRKVGGDALRKENERKMARWGYHDEDEWDRDVMFAASGKIGGGGGGGGGWRRKSWGLGLGKGDGEGNGKRDGEVEWKMKWKGKERVVAWETDEGCDRGGVKLGILGGEMETRLRDALVTCWLARRWFAGSLRWDDDF
ncbi:hypothetical protein BDY21DRAFT_340056 [Lineolata rhizophorae]|uniref:Uncharacterized protein n=1 Tax=Lineolata rhizophorae TaxID=578093 RepID=A0A6A6P5A9_9PEZI|nr:hypothetical protein BDY21DRAFT_340056 [Lineolata rhizophorae]